ncbi:hypothetical protein JTB14_007860 [Gonioctena quinquepunctata]|nr:hypothetical protein JTB14_007860 [Gonioctena quinquepunctata]
MASSRDGRSSSASSHSGSNVPPNRSSIRTPKRPRPTTGCSLDDKHTDFLCPVCFNLIEEAHITKCGHTYCYNCITKSIETQKRCPKCNSSLTAEEIFPNFLLNDLIKKHKLRINGYEALGLTRDSSGEFSSSADGLRDFVASESQNLTLPDVNVMLEVLTQRKQLLEAESCAAQNRLLLEFLKQLLKVKRERQAQMAKEITIIESDIEEVGNKLKEVHNKCPTLEDVERTAAGVSETDASTVNAMKKEMIEIIDKIGSSAGRKDEETPTRPNASLAMRRRRMHAYFNDFVECYFSYRSKDVIFGKDNLDNTAKPALEPNLGLDQFRESLIKFSTYNSIRVLSTLNYSSDLFNNSTIVSSIEFDKDNEFFAIAGVTKRIKVFDYGGVVKDIVGIHYPCIEMVSRSKISCISWHNYHKSTLASSDYEGTVTIWDASTGQRTKTYQEHEKRCWSVDFNCVDTRLIASGSDDARVKLYSLNEEHSVATLEAKANVCCVKFNPRSSSHLAFGSADHCVHYYDLRNMKEAVSVFKGHKKAVSYVKFLNSEEIVSASTDSQLKMWSINTPYCLRSFVGHVNEKNFVGLATDGDYVACGSENNALYVYYKGLSKKLFSFKFQAIEGVLEQERREDDMNEFVSAVCWKQNSNVVVAANSRVAVVGLGKKCEQPEDIELMNHNRESIRIAASAGCRILAEAGIKNIQVENFHDADAAAEGSVLGTWKFQEYKTKKVDFPQIQLFDSDECSAEAWKRGVIRAEAQNLARKLADTPSNLLTPTIFCDIVPDILTPLGFKVNIHDEKWAEAQKMFSFLSVAKGSVEPPKFLEITYNKGDKSDSPFVLVGKGVTFDAGGISLKPAAGMDQMRADMGGAASVIGAIYGIAKLGIDTNMKILIPLVENMPSGSAVKPGDVVTARNGKTICVDNTDAEGRLILADALCYSSEFKPKWVLDVATLTGAVAVALGTSATGVFSNSNTLYTSLEAAGSTTGDRVWRLPLWKHFTKQMTEFPAYDLNNISRSKVGGSCTAAAFLREFIPNKTEWMHLDIAGVMGPDDDTPYLHKGMTGRPTRTLIEFIESQAK